ncbi:MAG: efflux RND transporter periplasmic adaptor subunit [Candidatus Eisenbacteria bacterium]
MSRAVRFVVPTVLLVAVVAAAWFVSRSRAPKPEFHPLGPYSVAVFNEPATPRTGENTLRVVIEDQAGKPVRGARVEPVVSMPAMGAMPYMESRGRVTEGKPGRYRVAYGLSMAGEWDVALRITAPGAEPVDGRWRLSTHLPEVAFADGQQASAADTGAASATLVIDEARRQAIGVRTALVERRDLVVPVRARGTAVFDETARAVVSMRYVGWVHTIAADFTGKAVRRGDVLFTVDSPEVVAAQQEYLTALRFADADSVSHAVAFGGGGSTPPPTLTLAEAARQRLLSWGVTAEQVARVRRSGQPLNPLPVRSPADGVVLEKSIVAGSPFTPGQVLISIARIDPIWIEARVYEADLPLVRVGLAASVEYAGLRRRGKVTFVAPSLDTDSRTGIARIELPNPGGALKPGMFVDVTLDVELGSRLAVPEGAVVPTGTRQIVFVDRGGGRLEPREVTVGPRAGGWIAIERGLAEGETVVSSGNFLVAADARLRSALGKW